MLGLKKLICFRTTSYRNLDMLGLSLDIEYNYLIQFFIHLIGFDFKFSGSSLNLDFRSANYA